MSNYSGVRTAPASSQRMSKESSPALQSKPVSALEIKEMVTPIPPPIGLTELTASLKTLNAGMDKRPTIVHHPHNPALPRGLTGSLDPWIQGTRRRLHPS